MCCATRRATSDGQPPARTNRRARSIMSRRSSSVSWLNLSPRRTRSALCATNQSTLLCKNPTRFRLPSNKNRRLTSPNSRHREIVFVETLNILLSSSTVWTGSPASSTFTLAESETSSTNRRRSCANSLPSTATPAAVFGRYSVIPIAQIVVRIAAAEVEPPPATSLLDSHVPASRSAWRGELADREVA